MRYNEANIFVFIASIIIGILISLNISLSRESSISMLSSSQYMDAYNYKTQLYGEISSLVNQYNTYEKKLTSYKLSEQKNNSISDEIKKELDENNMILGKTAVTGQGLAIVLNDADSIYFENTPEDQFRLVHNTDIIQVLNDLRNAGAEAISLNRNLLYTGITRAKQMVVIVGSKRSLHSMVNNNRGFERYSMLKWRITDIVQHGLEEVNL